MPPVWRILAKWDKRVGAVTKIITETDYLRHTSEMFPKTNSIAETDSTMIEKTAFNIKRVRMFEVIKVIPH